MYERCTNKKKLKQNKKNIEISESLQPSSVNWVLRYGYCKIRVCGKDLIKLNGATFCSTFCPVTARDGNCFEVCS